MKQYACTVFPGIVSLLFTVAATAQPKQTAPIGYSTTNAVFRPALTEASDANITQLKLPPGFTIAKFADGLGKPRMLAVHRSGAVYVTNREEGTLTLLKDENADGKADIKRVVARKPQLHGITIRGDSMFLVTVKELYRTVIRPDGNIDSLQLLMNDLPDGGQHGNRTIETGPDSLLYLSAGSTCNNCRETNQENATLLQIAPDGKSRRIYAKGLRNLIGFDWHPQTHELFGFDHGIDGLGDDDQPEELNKITDGGDYGWPYVYANEKFDKHHDPPGTTHEEYAKKTILPLLLYTAHAAPLDLIFYTGKQFPTEFTGDALVTMHGSWNRSKPSGYKVVRVRFKNGQPEKAEDFITGWLINNDQAQFGRVCGLALYNDGSVLVSDDANGVIYRVSYNKGSK